MASYTYCGNKGTNIAPSGGASGDIGTQQHFNGNVDSGVPDTITPAAGNIKSLIVQNPNSGPNKNASGKVLLISFDNGVTYFSIPNGGAYTAKNIDESIFKLDAFSNNTNYEIILEYI